VAGAALLDLDGTLIDANYQHALAWYRAFRLVSTWSVLRMSCKPRSPVGLVNQPANTASANDELALAA